MSKKISIKALLLLIVFSVSAFSYDSTAGAGDSSGAMTSQMIRKFTETTTWLKQSNLEITASPDQAFISDYILVFGRGDGIPPACSVSEWLCNCRRYACEGCIVTV